MNECANIETRLKYLLAGEPQTVSELLASLPSGTRNLGSCGVSYDSKIISVNKKKKIIVSNSPQNDTVNLTMNDSINQNCSNGSTNVSQSCNTDSNTSS